MIIHNAITTLGDTAFSNGYLLYQSFLQPLAKLPVCIIETLRQHRTNRRQKNHSISDTAYLCCAECRHI